MYIPKSNHKTFLKTTMHIDNQYVKTY